MLGLKWKNILMGVAKGAVIGGGVMSLSVPLLLIGTVQDIRRINNQLPHHPDAAAFDMAGQAQSQLLPSIMVGWPLAWLQFSVLIAIALCTLGLGLLTVCIRSGRGGMVPVTMFVALVAAAVFSPLLLVFANNMSMTYLFLWIVFVCGSALAFVKFWKTADPEDLHFQSYEKRSGLVKSAFLERLMSEQKGSGQ